MKKIIETAIANGTFKTLLSAIKAAGLSERLSGPGPFTVFAPNDDAFDKLPEGAVEELLKDIPRLRRLLAYHVVEGKALATEVLNISSVKTVDGRKLTITSNKGTSNKGTSNKGVKVNDARMVRINIACDNGVIHAIDTVLTLPARSTAN
jgi:uncharacterized surface protein with fasciclin (FAS1) repeats